MGRVDFGEVVQVKKLLGLAFVSVALFLVWTMFRPKNTTTPKYNVDVDVNKGAHGVKQGSDTLADQVQSWTPETWKIVIGLIIAAGVAWLWFNKPAFKWAVIGGGLMVLVVMVFV